MGSGLVFICICLGGGEVLFNEPHVYARVFWCYFVFH